MERVAPAIYERIGMLSCNSTADARAVVLKSVHKMWSEFCGRNRSKRSNVNRCRTKPLLG